MLQWERRAPELRVKLGVQDVEGGRHFTWVVHPHSYLFSSFWYHYWIFFPSGLIRRGRNLQIEKNTSSDDFGRWREVLSVVSWPWEFTFLWLFCGSCLGGRNLLSVITWITLCSGKWVRQVLKPLTVVKWKEDRIETSRIATGTSY